MRKKSAGYLSRSLITAIAIALVATLVAVGTALAQPKPEFQWGFKTLADQIPEVVGSPIENEQPTANGDTVQKTTNGLMVWRKVDNLVAFTNGNETWLNGPDGLQKRSNSERFSWERSSPGEPGRDVVFQFSTINALMEGMYDGAISISELKKHGDFGLGTFDTLDGEMIMLDGNVFRIRADGAAYPVDDAVRSPFAAVAFFHADETVEPEGPVAWDKFASYMDSLLPTMNLPYAIKVEGEFSYLKARSVPGQTKPYPKLVEVTGKQPTFEFHDIRGTLVGFRLPVYMEGVNVPGYHFHFLTEDGKAGGHLLELQLDKGRIEVDYLSDFRMELPRTDDFYRLDLTKDMSEELDKAER